MTPIDGIEIPWQDLEADTLRRVVEEYITREGTDYGLVEVPLEKKVQQVLGQLRRGEAVLVFDPATETTGLAPRS